ncbi:MAG: PQQ-dependent sugar dehydrogenase [Armatimonadetes bacterium]|nr:PQQ-dependent sugar dehydrogenase [Armatimonadota bacterium]
MTKSFLFLTAAVLGVGACSFAPSSSDRSFGGSVGQQRVNVTQLWNENCASCHGEDGQGGGAGTQTLLTREMFGQEYDRPFFDAIKEGVPGGGMDAFGETLSDEAVWALVVHIRELQARALRAEFGSPTPVDGVYSSERHKFRVEDVVTEGLTTPWSVDWLSGGEMLVTNRPGGMHVYRGGRLVAEVSGLPPVVQQGQGGQMEVAVHPSGWVYISVADPVKEGRGAMTKVYRGRIVLGDGGARWTSQETIFEADQEYYSRAGVHFGCKITFDGEGHVFFGMGERGTQMRVQDDATPYGKVMRLNLNGTVPSDNPVRGNPMWSTGHRNHQGLVFDLEGNLWDTEHGPRGGDEINLILKGKNYGWPIVAFSINYNDSPFRVPWPSDGFVVQQPVYRWLPSVGASGLDVVRGPAFPNWRGDLLAGGLSGQNLDRYRMKDGVMVEREELLHGLGRVRDIAVHADGTVYVVLNRTSRAHPDRVVRLVPVG